LTNGDIRILRSGFKCELNSLDSAFSRFPSVTLNCIPGIRREYRGRLAKHFPQWKLPLSSHASENPTFAIIIELSEPAPAKLTDQALLIGWKEELGSTAHGGATKGSSGGTSVPDHDFHIVIADPANTKTQMIIEVPDPACQGVCSSKLLDKIKTARSAVSSQLGQPTANVVELLKPWLVEVTGPALFVLNFNFRPSTQDPRFSLPVGALSGAAFRLVCILCVRIVQL